VEGVSRVVPDSIGSVLRPQTLIFLFVIFPIYGFVDMQKLLPGTFQDFNFDILKYIYFSRNQPIETCVLIGFLLAVFGPVSGPKPAIQEGPGRFREGFREANNTQKSQEQE